MTAIENVTVLFTDLVGSTELAAAMTPAAADEMRRAHFSLLRQSVAASGGPRSRTLVTGSWSCFSAPRPPCRAPSPCSGPWNWTTEGRGRSLALRVGLSVGEATREGDDYFGDPVVVAAQAVCPRQGRPDPRRGCGASHGRSTQPLRTAPARCNRAQGHCPRRSRPSRLAGSPLSGVDAASAHGPDAVTTREGTVLRCRRTPDRDRRRCPTPTTGSPPSAGTRGRRDHGGGRYRQDGPGLPAGPHGV